MEKNESERYIKMESQLGTVIVDDGGGIVVSILGPSFFGVVCVDNPK